MPRLLWLRSDLRVRDNTALAAAAAAGPLLAVYLLSPAQWRAHDDAPCKVDFWLRNLAELSRDLAALNIPLLLRCAERWDDAPAVLLDPITGDIEVTYQYPAYTKRDPRTLSGTGGDLRAPRGTEVRLVTRADRVVKAAELVVDDDFYVTSRNVGPAGG